LRAILDLCVDQLETLAWGEPSDEVRMIAPRFFLETIALDLFDGGHERLANPVGWNTPTAQRVRRQGRRMIRAADAISSALTSEPQYQKAPRSSTRPSGLRRRASSATPELLDGARQRCSMTT